MFSSLAASAGNDGDEMEGMWERQAGVAAERESALNHAARFGACEDTCRRMKELRLS
jgi:hypothetical protein